MSSSKNILVAEDEKPLASALKLKLEHEGFKVTVSINGKDCLDQLAKDKFDILLLDLMMPVIDGFEVLKQLQSFETKPSTFVLSNLSQPEDEKRVMELGAYKFFVKSNTPLATIIGEIKDL